RPARLGVVTVAGADLAAGPAAGGDAVELRAAAVVAGVDDFVAAGRPRGRALHAGRVREPVRPTAACARGIELRVAVLAQDNGQFAAVGRIARAGIGAGKLDDAIARAAAEFDLVDIGVAALVTGVDELAA